MEDQKCGRVLNFDSALFYPLCYDNSVKTHVNRSNFSEKLGFQEKIFNKETILFIPCKVLHAFKANKVR